MTNAPFHSRAELLEWVETLPPAARIHTARMLADRQTTGALAALADATAYELSRDTPVPALAPKLGLTVRQLRRAVDTHRRRQDAHATSQEDERRG